MPRPVGADAARTRSRIRDAAAPLFAAHGLDGVSIRDVVSAAGVSVAMVNHHFGSKEDLYTAVIDAMYDELAALQHTLLALPPTPDLVDRAVGLTFGFARQHQPAIRLTLYEVLAAGELPAARRNRWLLPFLDTVTRVFPRRDKAELRFRAQSIVFLIVRYALATPAEIARIAGLSSPSLALARVEEHLAALAHVMLEEPVKWSSTTASASAPPSPTSSAGSSRSTGSSSSRRSRRPPKSR